MVKKLGAGTVSLCERNQDSGATFKNSNFFAPKRWLFRAFFLFLALFFDVIFFCEKKYRLQNVKHVWASTHIEQHVCGAV